MNKRTTDQWEALLGGLEGVTLEAGHQTFPAFDDDPDQSPVDMPCVWIAGMEGKWSNIGAPDNLVPVLAASIDSVAEVVRLRRAIAELAAEERATADDEFFPVHLRDLCRAYADDLDRILEEDNDE